MKTRLAILRRALPLLAVALLPGHFPSLRAAGPPKPAGRPNVLYLLADDLGYADLSVQGCKDVPTPNIDSIARNGVRFTNGYVSAPVCSPTRAGLITGRYQTRFGHEFNHPLADRSSVGLPTDQKTAANWFKGAGYVTGHIGKWHLGNPNMPQYVATARGFDEDVWFPGQKKLPPLNVYRNGAPETADDRYVDEAMAREAEAFVGRHCTEPWFLYVAFLTGRTAKPPHEALFWRYGEQIAVRAGNWKFVRAMDTTTLPPRLTTGLYNLAEDVSEKTTSPPRSPPSSPNCGSSGTNGTSATWRPCGPAIRTRTNRRHP
jgi:arylsulfatase A-like enzyme